uniref:Uncharacterized protein n=1 Tax=Anguilla anguilla TaxID=7936 RepID=A0A0E9QCF7_ANGAN
MQINVQCSCAWLMKLGSSCQTCHSRLNMNQDSAITFLFLTSDVFRNMF